MSAERLPSERHEAIRKIIQRGYLAQSHSQERPRAIIVTGQPGAGKGRLAEAAQAELADQGGSVLVDPDALRDSHPFYRQFLRENDKTAASRVHADSSQWAKELREDAIEGRRNIVLDATLNDKDKTHELLGQLRAAGYETEIRALAVNQRDSRQGVYARYENAREQGRPARWVPEDAQDEAYIGLPISLGHVERNGWADKVGIYRRDGSAVYRNDRAAAATSGLSQTALLAERGRDPTLEEKLRHLRGWEKIEGQMRERGDDSADRTKASEHRWAAYDQIQAEDAPPRDPSRSNPTPKPGAESIQALSKAQKARLEEWRRDTR